MGASDPPTSNANLRLPLPVFAWAASRPRHSSTGTLPSKAVVSLLKAAKSREEPLRFGSCRHSSCPVYHLVPFEKYFCIFCSLLVCRRSPSLVRGVMPRSPWTQLYLRHYRLHHPSPTSLATTRIYLGHHNTNYTIYHTQYLALVFLYCAPSVMDSLRFQKAVLFSTNGAEDNGGAISLTYGGQYGR